MISLDMCPHLVLGISSHASRDEAAQAFARASRRVRNTSSAPFTIQNLTSALSQIESTSNEESYRLHYAFPADPRVLRPGLRLVLEDGSHSETEELENLIGLQVSDQRKSALGFLFLNAAIHRLLQWEWSRAETYAKECLKLSSQEEVRDEALNAIALSLAMRGQTRQAIGALRKAVEGQWTLGLRTNLSILSFEDDPKTAIREMAFLISGERDSDRRLKACLLAIELWNRLDLPMSDTSQDRPPNEVLHASRLLLADAGLSEENFYQLGSFLARTDPEALKHSRCIDVSPHKRSPSGSLILARLNGFERFVVELVNRATSESSNRPWISQELEDFIKSAVSLFLKDSSSAMARGIALHLIEAGLDSSSFDRILLKGLLVQSLAEMCDTADRCPTDETVTWLSDAQRSLTRLNLVDEQCEIAEVVLASAAHNLGVSYLRFHIDAGNQAEDVVNRVVEAINQARHRTMLNQSAIHSALSEVMAWTSSVEQSFPRLIALVRDAELQSTLESILLESRRIRDFARNLMR